MKNVQNKQENVPTYVRLYDDLLSATHYRSLTTGTSIKLTSSAKLVYAKMKARFEYFRSVGKGYYDTQDDIAEATGLSRKGVNSILQDFQANGILVIELSGRNNVYTAISSLEFCSKDKAAQETPKSVVEPEALVEVIEEVAEEVMEENDWGEESEIVFVEHAPIPTPSPTASVKDPSKVYAGDYFSDYPAKFYKITGQHSDEFVAWLDGKGGVIVDNFHFTLGGIEYFIPYDPAWKLQDAV